MLRFKHIPPRQYNVLLTWKLALYCSLAEREGALKNSAMKGFVCKSPNPERARPTLSVWRHIEELNATGQGHPQRRPREQLIAPVPPRMELDGRAADNDELRAFKVCAVQATLSQRTTVTATIRRASPLRYALYDNANPLARTAHPPRR